MRRILMSALLMGAALGPAAALTTHATAADTPKAKRACFYSEDLRNFREVDNRTVNVLVGGKDVFQLSLFSDCPDISSATAIGIKTAMGQGFICDGLDIDIITPSPIGPRQCPVTRMRKLSPAEVAALPKGQRP